MDKEQAEKLIMQIVEWAKETNQDDDVVRRLASMLLDECNVDGMGGCPLCCS